MSPSLTGNKTGCLFREVGHIFCVFIEVLWLVQSQLYPWLLFKDFSCKSYKLFVFYSARLVLARPSQKNLFGSTMLCCYLLWSGDKIVCYTARHLHQLIAEQKSIRVSVNTFQKHTVTKIFLMRANFAFSTSATGNSTALFTKCYSLKN